MRSYLSVTPSRMRSINQTAVLEYIRINKIVSRSELSEKLGLSLPSILRITDDLMEKKLVKLSGKFESSGGGRRRPLIEIDESNNVIVSVDVGSDEINGVLVDIGGNIIERLVLPFNPKEPDRILDTLIHTIAPLDAKAKVCGKTYRGIAVSVPCVVERDTGRIITSTRQYPWQQLPMSDILRERFHVYNIVENDSNAAALGEMWFGDNNATYNLALIQLSKGLGAGLIVDGAIYRGTNNAAGEIGHLVFKQEQFRTFHSGEYGLVEQTIAGVGLIEKARKQLMEAGDPQWESVDYKRIFGDYKNGYEWPKQIIREFLDTLSMVIIVVHGMLDCEKVILSGEVMEHAYFLMDEIRNRIYRNIVVERTRIGSDANLLGGVVALLQRQMEYCTLKMML